ncbi:MAG: putative toxin-antitoxin system toxin component, PIN family [Treponema sp.]|nr:putative toxin-antitoxin system toxin component, PIN family [Treponema sp.]
MRVMLDSNILVSAIVFDSRPMLEIVERLASKYSMVLCSYVIDELRRVFREKFPKYSNNLENFLIDVPFELVHTPKELPEHNLFVIRDKKDESILYSAILADVDILVSGDKDLLVVEDVERPEILSHLQFLKKY